MMVKKNQIKERSFNHRLLDGCGSIVLKKKKKTR